MGPIVKVNRSIYFTMKDNQTWTIQHFDANYKDQLEIDNLWNSSNRSITSLSVNGMENIMAYTTELGALIILQMNSTTGSFELYKAPKYCNSSHQCDNAVIFGDNIFFSQITLLKNPSRTDVLILKLDFNLNHLETLTTFQEPAEYLSDTEVYLSIAQHLQGEQKCSPNSVCIDNMVVCAEKHQWHSR